MKYRLYNQKDSSLYFFDGYHEYHLDDFTNGQLVKYQVVNESTIFFLLRKGIDYLFSLTLDQDINIKCLYHSKYILNFSTSENFIYLAEMNKIKKFRIRDFYLLDILSIKNADFNDVLSSPVGKIVAPYESYYYANIDQDRKIYNCRLYLLDEEMKQFRSTVLSTIEYNSIIILDLVLDDKFVLTVYQKSLNFYSIETEKLLIIPLKNLQKANNSMSELLIDYLEPKIYLINDTTICLTSKDREIVKQPCDCPDTINDYRSGYRNERYRYYKVKIDFE